MSVALPTMGIKRHHDGTSKPPSDDKPSPYMPMFEVFRAELDEHHDRRERVIKASRDITAASKKIIFALQRVRSLNAEIPPKIASEIQERYDVIQKLFESIIPDLSDINGWRYQRSISPGIQEFMEAISFEHYLRTQTLITISEAATKLPEGILLTSDDYLLGLFDLIGELMRFGITTIATSGSLPGSVDHAEGKEMGGRDIMTDLRIMRAAFESLDTSTCNNSGLGKNVDKKMEVMRTCVSKVEMAVYGMIIRGRERPKGWIMEVAEERGVESY